MDVALDKQTIFVPRNLRTISPNNCEVIFVHNKGFFEIRHGTPQQYADETIGVVNWLGRQFIKTNATSFVRDGNEYFVYLPPEDLFITRLAGATDSSFVPFDFAETGIWDPRFKQERVVFGRLEWVSMSHDVTGAQLVTRANGEILELRDGELYPYCIDPYRTGGHIVRVDLERVLDGGVTGLLTIFYRLRSTLGAQLWLEHFEATNNLCKRAGPCGSPFLRNWNVVFYAGEEDFRNTVAALSETVRTINASYVSRREGAPGGKLVEPTVQNTTSALLNELHFEFELFGDRLKSDDHADRAAIAGIYGPFCQLNDRVHACEGALANRGRTRDEAWWAIHCAFLPDFYKPLPQEVYSEFTLDWTFGNLFMGYHTLGKDIIAAFWNKDEALFKRNEIRPQRISSAEIFAFFGPDTKGQLKDLRAWWREKDIDQYGFRLDDPFNSIGYIPIGDVLLQGLSESAFKEELAGSTTLAGISLTDQ